MNKHHNQVVIPVAGIAAFSMRHADLAFRHIPMTDWVLEVRDTWTGLIGTAQFTNESDMLRFIGEYLIHSDGPTEEFRKLFPQFC